MRINLVAVFLVAHIFAAYAVEQAAFYVDNSANTTGYFIYGFANNSKEVSAQLSGNETAQVLYINLGITAPAPRPVNKTTKKPAKTRTKPRAKPATKTITTRSPKSSTSHSTSSASYAAYTASKPVPVTAFMYVLDQNYNTLENGRYRMMIEKNGKASSIQLVECYTSTKCPQIVYTSSYQNTGFVGFFAQPFQQNISQQYLTK